MEEYSAIIPLKTGVMAAENSAFSKIFHNISVFHLFKMLNDSK